MSAIAPAGIAISITGNISAVCTSATLSADEAICVIAQAAPTPWIRMPRLESRLASQMRRKIECRNGAVMPSAAKVWRSVVSVMPGSDWPQVIPTRSFDARESPVLSRG